MRSFLWRGFAVWCAIIVAESLHGTARELWLRPLVGDFQARRIAFFSGMALILAIAWLCIRWIGARTRRARLAVGGLWAALTLAFEIALGRMAFRFSWDRIWQDYDLLHGGLMGLGLVFLLLAPSLAARLPQIGRAHV